MVAVSSQTATTSAGRPSRSAPSTYVTGTPGSRRASGGPPCETSATRFPSGSSNPASGTRKIAPAEALSAFGPVGSAQPRDSATDAPNASAARRIVPRFPGSATRQRESERLDATRQRLEPKETHDAGRVSHRRHLREQLRLDVLSGPQHIDRLDARVVGRLDEVLALNDEEAFPLALAPRLEKAVDQAELRVVGRGDHSSHCSQEPWKSAWPANSRSPPGQ